MRVRISIYMKTIAVIIISSEFQTSERASTRLAVRAITDKPVEPGRSAQQRVAPFPPTPLEPGVSGQLDFGTSRKRSRKSEEVEGESSTVPGGDAGSVKPKKIRTKAKITFTRTYLSLDRGVFYCRTFASG